MTLRSAVPALTLALLLAVLCTRADAQTPEEQVAAAVRLMDSNQYLKAIEIYQAIPESSTVPVRLRKQLGLALAHINLGRFNEVLPFLDEGERLANQIGTAAAHASALNVRGQYRKWLRQGDFGLTELQQAAVLAESGDPKALSAIYANLASAYQEFEDWERYLYYAQRSFALDPNPSLLRRRQHAMSMGIGSFELFDRDAAEAHFTTGLALAREAGARRDESFAIGELAYTYWTFDRDAPRAIALYTQAIEIARAAKVVTLAANWHNNRGAVRRDTGDFAGALADFREHIALLTAAGAARQTFVSTKNIGQTYRLMGRTSDAIAVLEPLIAERAADSPSRTLWQAHMELASAYDTAGHSDRAEAQYRAMLSVLEEQRNTSILDAFRTGSFAHALSAYDPYERFIGFLLVRGRVAEALEVAEQARARSFLESLASVRAAVARSLPAELLAEESQIRRMISAAQEKLRSSSLNQAQRASALGELSQAEDARDQFLLAMRVEHPALAEARYPTLLPAGEIQRSLRAGEMAVVFFLAEPASSRWIVTRDQIRHALLPGRAAIERDAARVRQLLRAPSDSAATRAAASQLSSALFDGAGLAGYQAMVVVPHGVLHYLPFEALPVGDRLLIEQRPISYAPSLNALVQLRRAPVNTATFRVLAVGNPALAAAASGGSERAGDRAQERAGDVENLALLGPLPFAERELHAIGRTFPDRTRILSGAGARESHLRSPGLSRYPVIHFATHGLVSDAQPKRSGLLMAPEPGEDGLLQMGEIYGLGLQANLIVLSACQTAIGREITGEGLVGISRAFFYAGARAVVATLWNLNDRFAAEFVERFYRELKTGVPAEDALRRAKLAYVNDPRYAHPFYWSSLVMLGDGTRALVAEPVPQPRLLLVLALTFGILALTVTALKRAKI